MKTFKRVVGSVLLVTALSSVAFAGNMPTGMLTSEPSSFLQEMAQFLISTLTLLP